RFSNLRMEDIEEGEKNSSREGEETASRGNEWEVVSLTASTYAAAPGPKEVEVKDDDKEVAETSHALFMSDHFVFPPSQHENLPLEPDSEILDEHVVEDVASGLHVEEEIRSGRKNEESWTLKDLNASEEFPGIQFLNEKDNKLSVSDTGFEESATLQELNVSDKEQSIYSASAFSSLDSKTGYGSSTPYGENLGIPDMNETSEWDLDRAVSNSPEPAKDDAYDGPGVPCEAWWKRGAASLYAHAKEANTFWSIFIAAAVMGLVMLGQRWQQEKWQVLQLKWQASINNERTSRMLGPLTRLKDVIVGGHRRGSFIRAGASVEN
ncbi:hypothetical protein Tsubulata_020148, partial [Turnera subulata]